MDAVSGPVAGDPPFGAWNAAVGAAAAAIGTRRFPDALMAALRMLAPAQMMNGFFYAPDGRAFDLYNERLGAARAVIVDRYLAGAFVLDPFRDAVMADGRARMIAMGECAPDGFVQTEYYRLHYAATRIVDEIGFVIPLADLCVGVLSLCRLGPAPPFADGERERLRAAAPVVCAFGHRHWFHAPGRRRAGGEAVPVAGIEDGRLTRREIEIVTLILKGHSTPSLAAVLGCAPNTVKVHRRRIYAKLGISCQAELFRLFWS
ncbi:helix-turn-helix transcriptional regulator [Gluconacetobacter takamatsuzukensis]|uniref:Helix-turn-helix transcriptional regulator n=1 Tax=Gluconacetobacter takamatsuzukensis TaxID=1286190 RepID=A0A7W4KF70_9PROT|nr:helix-turn-helix transcriptional regulator [Gluconacetobacter takamatsuzukensis]MBB2205813.1 helix-turn-helix transcriptional regulator [Gluconacetobacter takamatsuzukensis]